MTKTTESMRSVCMIVTAVRSASRISSARMTICERPPGTQPSRQLVKLILVWRNMSQAVRTPAATVMHVAVIIKGNWARMARPVSKVNGRPMA